MSGEKVEKKKKKEVYSSYRAILSESSLHNLRKTSSNERTEDVLFLKTQTPPMRRRGNEEGGLLRILPKIHRADPVLQEKPCHRYYGGDGDDAGDEVNNKIS